MQRRRPPSVYTSHPVRFGPFVGCLALGLVLAAQPASADKKESVVIGDTVDVSKISNHLGHRLRR